MMIRNNIYKILIGFLFLFLTWLMLFNYSHCASEQDFFPMHQNHNGKFTDDVINKISTQFDSTNNYIFCRWDSYTYNRNNIYVLVWSKNSGVMLYGEKNTNLEQFSLYTVGGNIPLSTSYKIEIPNNASYINIYQNFNLSMYGGYSSNYTSNTDYVSNFQLMTNNTSSAKVVLFYDDGITIPEGDTARDDMEKPDSADYYPDWSNAPSFDNSTVENALQSIFNYFVWFGGNIKGTIEGLGNFISDTVRWSIQKVLDKIEGVAQGLLTGIQSKINDVITTIGGKIDTFTGKLEDLYEAFTDFADLFIHPFDEEEYEEQIANCQLISQYDELMDNCEDIRAIFNNAVERDYFVLYIDFENPFADSEHKIIHSQISFTWLKDYRNIYRPFLWVFTMMECFISGMRLLGGIIGGKAK